MATTRGGADLLNRLQTLAVQVQGRRAGATEKDAERLAGALSWDDRDTERRTLPGGPHESRVAKGFIANQPAAVFFGTDSRNNRELLHGAALFAYLSSVDWGIIAGRDEITVLNSHWVKAGDWFSLPPILWSQIPNYVDVLEALTPEGLTHGRIEVVATRFAQPDRMLRSVDDALVERLDYWRGEAARYSKSLEEIDERLHTFFAQLFVLRSAEDRQLTDRTPPLTSALSARGLDRNQLSRIFETARDEIQSDLFDVVDLGDIPEFVLSGIINDLYFPKDLPIRGARYDFSLIDADVLGRAYEKYLSNVIAHGKPARQMMLLDEPMREIERIDARKSGGIYYTPQYLVNFLTNSALDHVIANSPDFPRRLPRVADPSCGSGSFLTTAVSSLVRRLRAHDPDRNWGRELVRRRCICGVDRDARAVTLARLSLWLRLAQEPDPLPLPRLNATIVEGDSLDESTWSTLPQDFDVILGNPPFMSATQIAGRDTLSDRFKSAAGRFDYSYLFVELGVQKLREGGVLGMVVPNRLFRNRDASGVRDLLTQSGHLFSVCDFGTNEVFRGTNAYIGTILFSRDPGDHRSLRHIKVLRLPLTRYAGLLLGAASAADLSGDYIRSFIARHPSGSEPWLFLSSATMSARMRLQEQSDMLAERAGIYQGIKVGANDIFIVSAGPITGGVTQVQNGLGDSHVVEAELLHPVVYGSEIVGFSQLMPTRFLIYPYIADTAIPESKLQSEYPNTWSYLSRYREFLTGRSTVQRGDKAWYELAWERSQEWLNRPKLVIRDLAMETAFAVDSTGGTYLVGGTAVVPSEQDMLLPLLAYLNSQLVNWYLNPVAATFRADFQKFEPQHLGRIPILRQVADDPAIAEQLAACARSALDAVASADEGQLTRAKAQVDELLCQLIGIDPSEIV